MSGSSGSACGAVLSSGTVGAGKSVGGRGAAIAVMPDGPSDTGRLVGSPRRVARLRQRGASPRIQLLCPAAGRSLHHKRLPCISIRYLRLFVAVVALPLALAPPPRQEAHRQGRRSPVFSYKVDGKLEALIRDDAKFRAFARELRRDTDRCSRSTT
jgi:hypothetical protein